MTMLWNLGLRNSVGLNQPKNKSPVSAAEIGFAENLNVVKPHLILMGQLFEEFASMFDQHFHPRTELRKSCSMCYFMNSLRIFLP